VNLNPILTEGELGYTTNTKIIKFGNGLDGWNALPVAAAGDIMAVKAGNGLRYVTGTSDTTSQTEPTHPPGGESGTVILEIDDNKVITTNAMNAKGDLLVGVADNQYTVLTAGSAGQALVVNTATASGLEWGTVTDPVISNNYISNAMLASNSVTEPKIRGSATVDADRSVTTDKIRDSAITAPKMAPNAVTTNSIENSQVTEAKLSGDGTTDSTRAVTTNKIRNLAVTKEKIANGVVDASKVGADVYQRSTTGFTATSARVFINNSAIAPTGSAGDIWFKYA
jgi:hypothetical protein